MQVSGSPPRARGKVPYCLRRIGWRRITPACAGKRGCSLWFDLLIGDHPRVRGEKRADADETAQQMGSPPRARGKVLVAHTLAVERGITPACAGKSSLVRFLGRADMNHPRVRGEKFIEQLALDLPRGSPPRARGKVERKGKNSALTGITPACAGKRSPYTVTFGRSWDHPRVRGEKWSAIWPVAWRWGSPPRARGKAQNREMQKGEKGITPACAGKSASFASSTAPAKDHPRVRGEKAAIGQKGDIGLGSPPRARGKVFDPAKHFLDLRITPACAGKSII